MSVPTAPAGVTDGSTPATVRFVKGHGTRNDFVMLFDEHGALDLTAELVRALADRRSGIGADGVIRAVRAGSLTAGEGVDPQLWFMDYWNADGTTSEMCGNGARVFGAFLEREAGLDLSGGLTFATRGGERTVTALGKGRYAVGMGTWRIAAAVDGADAVVTVGTVGPDSALTDPVVGRWLTRPGLSVDVGNPHTVVALASQDELAALDLSRAPRVEPVPPAGSNVEFAVVLGEGGADGQRRGVVAMRVHERGSGETESCGTGAVATALAVRAWAGPGAPDVWDVRVPGGEVTVRIDADRAVLEGPAVLVAEGVFGL